ncbi:ATP-dependent RNA helicase eIF4A [Hypsizygus marmoreus]|uniref:RNA helicase n=1 Tax=Hypsizygus marmoreus TaxID=39966 RepID=A0A369JTA5_HYPMA|nr:ATP-dependent RNA helicase eIF4A [Hypsizygus marmoreus]
MARSMALNPASMPFFPGGLRGIDDGGNGLGFRHSTFREQDRSSMSSLSISPSEYRSARSSPSPPSETRETPMAKPSPESMERSRESPAIRQLDTGRPHPLAETRVAREGSMVGSLGTLPEGDDNQETPGPTSGGSGTHTPGASFFSLLQQRSRERMATPPVTTTQNGSPFYGVPTSSSPVSSLDSGSHFASSVDQPPQSFEAQLQGSPMIQDILTRLVQCEYATREIQRDLSDVHRKVNLLVERSVGVNSKPEFKDPFAPSTANGHGFSSPPLNVPRPSMGNIAPHQPVPSDDISTISQRLNTLTSSVGQLLAIQTQQIQSTNPDIRNNSIIGLNHHHGDIAPNQTIPTPTISNPAALGHGLPHRSEQRSSIRHPNPPMRTWSAGTLDLPPIRSSDPNIGRQPDPGRDKRRSVTGLLRRESTGVVDPQADSWANGSPRDSGPVISKWEQLSLAPELLRSLNKFGVGPPNKIQQRALPFLLRGSDIIAQAPPTQERIAAYVIPAIQIAVTNITVRPPNRGPIVIMISTTVDQATQAQRMIRDLGGPIGVRSALGVGATSANNDLSQELRLLQQNMPHVICGTPQKLHALFTSPGGLSGSEVRFLVLDEVDQLIARNLHDFVFNIVKLLPPPRSRPLGSGTPSLGATPQIPFNNNMEPSNGIVSPFQSQGRRFSAVPITPPTPAETSTNGAQGIERQTALFSNTVPQDVLNLASAIQLREPVRVLVRRDGNVTHADTNQGSRGLRQFYLYLAFTAGARSDPTATAPGGGLGIIGSGRGASSAETAQAREWKLDALADLFDDVEVNQAIVHVGGMTALDSVVYKLASRGLEAIPLHGDMNAGTKLAALNKFRNSNSVIMRQPATKVLVVYDVQVKTPDVSHVPLIVNYDLPKAVEEYAHRVAPAVASNYARAGVIVNFVTATGGDVEMLRSIECFYKIKCPEVPMTLRDII